jgi:hypothetical protein
MTGSTLVGDLNQQAPQMYGRGLATTTPGEPTLRKIAPKTLPAKSKTSENYYAL